MLSGQEGGTVRPLPVVQASIYFTAKALMNSMGSIL